MLFKVKLSLSHKKECNCAICRDISRESIINIISSERKRIFPLRYRTNRFKGLELIECLKNYAWRFITFYRRQ